MGFKTFKRVIYSEYTHIMFEVINLFIRLLLLKQAVMINNNHVIININWVYCGRTVTYTHI